MCGCFPCCSPKNQDVIIDDSAKKKDPLKITLRMFQITLIVGLIIGALGTLALLSSLSHAGAMTPLLQKISVVMGNFASAVGSNPSVLSYFITSIGATCVFMGTVGWIHTNCRIRANAERKSSVYQEQPT